MAKVTLIFAALLIALGMIGYFGTPSGADADAKTDGSAAAGSDQNGSDKSTDDKGEDKKAPKRSITAMIPAFAGILLLICGLIALNEGLRMHAMHGAVLVGLLGFLAAGGRGAMGLVKLLGGDATVNQRSLLFVWLMAILCAVYVGLCVKSFIDARKKRKAEEAAAAA